MILAIRRGSIDTCAGGRFGASSRVQAATAIAGLVGRNGLGGAGAERE